MELPEYPNYIIYTNGDVYSKPWKRYKKPTKDKDGYLFMIFYKNGKSKLLKVHRVVAITYLPNPNNYKEVNHKNGIRDDNRVENLEWCDRNYNMKSVNTSKNVGQIYKRKYGNKWGFRITIKRKEIYYGCPSENIAENMREIFIDLL